MPASGTLVFLVLLTAFARADVRCPAIFGDHMVLQRERPVAIWGDAAAGEAVTVEFAGQTVTAAADSSGHWRAQLAPMPASAESRTLTVRATNVITYSDVLVGEVWLCSGQSNMEKQLGPRGGQKPTDHYEEETRHAQYPLLRLFQMPQHGRPQKGVLGLAWVPCTPENVTSTQFSAAGYFFGREVLRELNVPVGIIHSSFGGTQIEAWIPEAAFSSHTAIRDLRGVTYQAWVKGVQATELYESMIRPLVPFTLRGFLWYQGESNCMQADGAIYTEKLRALFDGWREAWGDAALPFYFVQLAPFDYSRWNSFPKALTAEALPVVWEAQARAATMPHTGMIVTTDLVPNLHDIHPTNKRDVGIRLARLALADTYGRPGPEAHSPAFERMTVGSDGKVEVRFRNTGGALRTSDGLAPSGFTLAGADTRFVAAEAKLDGDRVLVWSPEVPEPVALRFGWNEIATPNLVNAAGLPTVPFRTDAWPVQSERSRSSATASASDLEKIFQQPPTEARPWVFWYWMNAAVTREGITADLAAMKEAGIVGAYLFTIRGATQPPLLTPPVDQLSPPWWDCVRFAFVEADRLGLKLALHASDGFATAGGPWITPELSMQKVVWSETLADGGRRLEIALPQPPTNEDYYRDIAVYALPEQPGRAESSRTLAPVVTTNVPGTSPQFLAGTPGKDVFRSEGPCWIQYAFPRAFTCRAITITLTPAPNAYQPNTYQANRLAIEVSDDGVAFRRVAHLVPPRHGWQDGDADITHAIEPVTARFFRFVNDPAGAEPAAEDLDSAKWKPTLKLRAIELTSRPTVDGFEGKSGAVWRVAPPTPEAAIPKSEATRLGQVVNLTGKLRPDGRLDWDAPAGHWRILRLGHTSTGHRNETGGAAKGLECDKFNPAAVGLQFDHWIGEIIRHVGPDLTRRVLRMIHVDSWECGSQNWSRNFPEEFRRRRGYDPLPYLPAMAGVPIESAEAAERFLRDVRTTIAELVADNFYAPLEERAHGIGCELSAESVAPTMVSDGLAHFARVDVPMGEFWLRSPTNDKVTDILDAVSGARAYGRAVVQAESFTERSLQWDESPALVKPLQDRNYAFGVNRVVYHVFAHNPWPERKPGLTLSGVGLFFQPNQTWWRHAGAWVDYAARCQALLQAGKPVADVLVYTGDDVPSRAVVPWHLATTLPGMVHAPAASDASKPARAIIDPADWVDPLHGYAYDSINGDALVRNTRLGDGRVDLPGGLSYPILIVPAAHPMSPAVEPMSTEVSGRLRDITEAGATVIFGTQSAKVPRLSGKPVILGPFTKPNFESLGVAPDATFSAGVALRRAQATPTGAPNATNEAPAPEPAGGIAWIHRTGKGWDLYFLANQQPVARDITASLRVSGRTPELWDPVTGDRRPARTWRSSGGRTELPLHLAPAGSVFIVFRTGTTESAAEGPINGAELPVTQTLAGDWVVQFDAALGSPREALHFGQLVSWTARPEPGVKDYSGAATYTHTFTWSPSPGKPAHVWMDLGAVRETASVSVNGTSCGVAWTPPYRVDVKGALREGTNEVRIEVTNTWFNRLAADRDLPQSQRITWTTGPFPRSDKPRLESGLLGPVTLRVE